MGIFICTTIRLKSLILYTGISIMYLNYQGTLTLNYINNLKNVLSGQSIWIIGSDPSLNTYPDNFMEDKNGMALHLAYEKFQTDFTYANELDRVKAMSWREPASVAPAQSMSRWSWSISFREEKILSARREATSSRRAQR